MIMELSTDWLNVRVCKLMTHSLVHTLSHRHSVWVTMGSYEFCRRIYTYICVYPLHHRLFNKKCNPEAALKIYMYILKKWYFILLGKNLKEPFFFHASTTISQDTIYPNHATESFGLYIFNPPFEGQFHLLKRKWCCFRTCYNIPKNSAHAHWMWLCFFYVHT